MRTAFVCLLGVTTLGCGTGPLYPSRPPATPGDAIADPTPSRIVVHATVTTAALKDALDQNIPSVGAGTFPLLGSPRKYLCQPGSIAGSYLQGPITLQSPVIPPL